MDHTEVGQFWEGNAEAWTKLARAGYDIYRDKLNTPAFFAMLPDVTGLVGLDLGCGEGHNTRLLADRGAQMTAIDIAETFIAHARRTEVQKPQGIHYLRASALELPFPNQSFDFATAFMSFMDIPETDRLLAEVFRVLKPGAFLQLSISHPCFDTPFRNNVRRDDGVTFAVEVGDYFRVLEGEISEWIFSTAPMAMKAGFSKFKIPRFTRPISQWINLFLETGFILERLEEPRPSDEDVEACPSLQDAQVVAYFLHVRVRKPAVGGVG